MILNKSILDTIEQSIIDPQLESKKEIIELLDNLYKKSEEMPVWPFNIKTLTSFVAVAFGPIIFILLEVIIGQILSKYF